jgi:hypothetical protein
MKKNFIYESSYQSEYKQRIQEAIEYILTLKYGDTIPFEKLGHILHYNIEDEKENKKFKSTMGRVKNFLIDKGYVLKTITGIGYYILKPKQISSYCYRTYISKTQNLLDKSNRILMHTETFELSKDRKEEYDDVLELNTNVNKAIEEQIITSPYYANKNYYNSLED